MSGIRKVYVESANCKWKPHFVCGFRLHICIYVVAFKIKSFNYMILFHLNKNLLDQCLGLMELQLLASIWNR